MARSTGRKRFWFQQNRLENQTQETKSKEELKHK